MKSLWQLSKVPQLFYILTNTEDSANEPKIKSKFLIGKMKGLLMSLVNAGDRPSLHIGLLRPVDSHSVIHLQSAGTEGVPGRVLGLKVCLADDWTQRLMKVSAAVLGAAVEIWEGV